MPSLPRTLLTCLFCILASCLSSLATAAEDRRVLVLYSLGADSSSNWQRLVHKGIYEELARSGNGATPSIYEERFDANRVGEDQVYASMAPYLTAKYANVQFDAVVTENFVAGAFLSAHPELFPGVPRYYVNHGRPGWEPPDGKGYEVQSDFALALGVIPRVAPGIKRVIVVGDQSQRSQPWMDSIRAIAPRFAPRLAFEYWDDKSYAELRKGVQALGRDSAVFLLVTVRDAEGQRMLPGDLARELAGNTRAPVFTHAAALVESGVVGGYVINGEAVGQMIGQILLGQPAQLPQYQGYYFDFQAAQRFGLSNLPPESVILNRPHSVWDLYRWQIAAAIALMVVEGVLITALVLALRDRRRTMAALADERNNLEDRVLQRTLELLQANRKLEELATTDPLTGIANRRKMTEQIAHELERARRFGQPLALLMIDIDHFKRINDTHGHEVGDQAIVAVAGLLGSALRSSDLVARFGGEEFVLLMPGTDMEPATHAAERLRQGVEQLYVAAGDGTQVALTISIGVSDACAGDTPSSLLVRADKGLYRAKKEGRNCVIPYPAVAMDALP